MPKFKVGDRIICTSKDKAFNGQTGTIYKRYAYPHGETWVVLFDKTINASYLSDKRLVALAAEYMELHSETPFDKSLNSYLVRELPDA